VICWRTVSLQVAAECAFARYYVRVAQRVDVACRPFCRVIALSPLRGVSLMLPLRRDEFSVSRLPSIDMFAASAEAYAALNIRARQRATYEARCDAVSRL